MSSQDARGTQGTQMVPAGWQADEVVIQLPQSWGDSAPLCPDPTPKEELGDL